MTVGRSKAREIGASDLCVADVSNGNDKSAKGEEGEVVEEPWGGPVGDEGDVGNGPNASAQVVRYCTLTPAPFASTPVCKIPLPKPPHR